LRGCASSARYRTHGRRWPPADHPALVGVISSRLVVRIEARSTQGGAASMTRNERAEEILRTVEMPRLIAAAGVMLRVRRGVETVDLSAEELAKFVETLDVLGLETLRAIALELQDPGSPEREH
jgi:hypothetical protein